MAEFVRTKECYVGVDKPIIFENKTDTGFKVATGIIFYKSGLYNVSIIGNKTTVSKVSEQKKGRWMNHRNDDGHNIADCSECGNSMQWFDPDATPSYCPNCGSYNGGEQDG